MQYCRLTFSLVSSPEYQEVTIHILHRPPSLPDQVCTHLAVALVNCMAAHQFLSNTPDVFSTYFPWLRPVLRQWSVGSEDDSALEIAEKVITSGKFTAF